MIHVETTPNPESLKFQSEHTISLIGTEEFQKNINTITNKFVKELLGLDGVELILLSSNFITVKKEPSAKWNDLKPMVISHINDYFEKNKQPILSDVSQDQKKLAPVTKLKKRSNIF